MYMKKVSLTGLLMALLFIAQAHVLRGRPVLERAIQNFSRDYKGALGADWTPLKEGGYVCRFTLDGVAGKAFYDKRGRWQSTVAGYTESRMPRSVRRLVLTNYYDYKILYVHEITMVGKATVFQVQVRDAHVIKVLRVADDQVEEIRELEATD